MLYRHWLRLLWVVVGTVLVINAGIRPVAAGHAAPSGVGSAEVHGSLRLRW